jgi:hypothetical protein
MLIADSFGVLGQRAERHHQDEYPGLWRIDPHYVAEVYMGSPATAWAYARK